MAVIHAPCEYVFFLFYHNKVDQGWFIKTESSSCTSDLCSAELMELTDFFGSVFADAVENV